MKSFKQYISEIYLSESSDDPHKPGSVSNNTKGVLHELLVGKHLNGGKHMSTHNNETGDSPKQAHDRLKASIHPDDYKKINDGAKSAAAHIKAHIESTHPGHIHHAVSWTSKPGDTEKVTGIKASQKDDSSDVYITTKHPKTGKETHHGISLKVTDNGNKNIPASSLGMESAGEQGRKQFEEHKATLIKKHPELNGKNKVQRKELLKNNTKLAVSSKAANHILLHKVAKGHAEELQNHIDSGNYKHVVDHIREILHAHNTPAEKAGHTFIKHTTYRTAKGIQHHTGKPGEDHERILKDPKNITISSSGGAVNFYHKGKKFATQSHKFESQSDPLSSLRSAGKAA